MKLRSWEVVVLAVVVLSAAVLVAEADARLIDLWWWIRR